ncbi:MAG: glycogen/starch/alpha-glucan phosphorylase [Oscillospiraceae bacterium]
MIQDFKEKIRSYTVSVYSAEPANCTPQQLHNAVASVIMREAAPLWDKSRERHNGARKASYLSMEFLVGRAIYNNLLCLGLTAEASEALSQLGVDISVFEEIEDAALGNGGLGRLAACFLDSAAALNLPLDGYGIRYKYGLFRQKLADGFQTEYADDWTRFGDEWSVCRRSESVTVELSFGRVRAVPYDYPVFGYKTQNIGTLRLWQAQAEDEFDFAAFNSGRFSAASEVKRQAEDISRVLYPNDETDEGKRLRLRQEYFFSAASVADLIRKHIARFGDISTFAEYNAIQLNDTHPVIALPELIRRLTEDFGYSFESAFELASRVFCYTNHTIMQEALEKWSAELLAQELPKVYGIILLINERFRMEMHNRSVPREKIEKMRIISGGTVHMANLAVYGSAYVNGVSQIHTDLLKTSVLKDWHELHPQRFLNQTNGITPRRWLALCNSELSSLITELLGGEEWLTDLSRLSQLKRYADDEGILRRFIEIKQAKKRQLARYILQREGIEINPSSIFDIQIKRLHEYKRQLMNALSLLWMYYELKSGSLPDFAPMTCIFGAKAAPGYYRAKGIIKLINEVGRLIESDSEISGKLRVVFVSNYNVSYAEKLVAAADISEQISTAGTEASGTGNMKLMLNGAVTLGTMDGANVEIVAEAGEENNYIFGARVEELTQILPHYDPNDILCADSKLRRALTTLIDGTLDDGGTGMFRELYLSLTEGASWHKADNYYVLGDLAAYNRARLQANSDYRNELAFAKKCWLNMCSAGKFSADRTVRGYADDIWHISEV